MKGQIFNINFLTAVGNVIPNKTQLASLLVDILKIEKEAVYRRLRGEVPFTFAEVAIISKKLHLSVDQILDIQTENDQTLRLDIHNIERPNEQSLVNIKNFISILEIMRLDFSSEVFDAWNSLPFPLCYQYSSLTNFSIFKKKYYCDPHSTLKKYKDVSCFPKLKEYQKKYSEIYKLINKSTFILDRMIIDKLVKEIHFFESIQLMDNKDIANFKKDLYSYLDYLEVIADTRKYPETGRSVDLYIAGVHIDTNYSTIQSKDSAISLIGMFNFVSSTRKDVYDNISSCLEAIKRFSFPLTDDPSQFFKEQRDLVSTL